MGYPSINGDSSWFSWWCSWWLVMVIDDVSIVMGYPNSWMVYFLWKIPQWRMTGGTPSGNHHFRTTKTSQLGISYPNLCCTLATLFFFHERWTMVDVIDIVWWGFQNPETELGGHQQWISRIRVTLNSWDEPSYEILYEWSMGAPYFCSMFIPWIRLGTSDVRRQPFGYPHSDTSIYVETWDGLEMSKLHHLGIVSRRSPGHHRMKKGDGQHPYECPYFTHDDGAISSPTCWIQI